MVGSIKVQHVMNPGTGETVWIFTFGYGHVHPRTGARLDERFVRINGNFEEARVEMVRRFGTKWGGQYANASEAGVDRFELRQLEGEEAFGAAPPA